MSTNAYIIVKNRNPGAVSPARMSYVHWDGGFWHVGALLLSNYNNEEAAQNIADAGSFSELAETIAESKLHGEPASDEEMPAPWGNGDPLENCKADGERHNFEYVWDGSNWYVAGPNGLAILLSEAVAAYNANWNT